MNATTNTESNTFQDFFGLATWNQPRTVADLKSFVANHDEALDVEDFDL